MTNQIDKVIIEARLLHYEWKAKRLSHKDVVGFFSNHMPKILDELEQRKEKILNLELQLDAKVR
jgi:hypothetical protein